MSRAEDVEFIVCDSPNCSCTEEEMCGDEAREEAEFRNSDECSSVEISPQLQIYLFSVLINYLVQVTSYEVQGMLSRKEIDVIDRLRKKVVEIGENLKIGIPENEYLLMGIREKVSLDTLTELASSPDGSYASDIAGYLLVDRRTISYSEID